MFEQMIILFAFMLIGFALGKTKRIDPKHAGIISTLIVYVCTPCINLRTFSRNFTTEYIRNGYVLMIAALIIIVVLHIGGGFFVKLLTKEPYEREIWRYSLVVPNYGYMGIAVVGGALGDAALMDFMVFTLPFNIYIYSIALPILTKSKPNLKNFVTPAMLSMIVGAAIGLLHIQLPDTLYTMIDPIANAQGPLSMILSGIVISEFRFRDLLGSRNIYIVSAIRLLVMPVLIGVPAMLLLPPAQGLIIVIFASLACGLNTVVFPKLVGQNCNHGAGLALVSSVAACATVPIIVEIFTRIFMN